MGIKTYSIPVKHITFEKEENEQLMRVKFFCISEGDNRNESTFNFDSISKCKESGDYAFKPILGAWEKSKITEDGIGGLGGHNSSMSIDRDTGDSYVTYLGENGERGLGVLIPNTAQIELYKNKRWLTIEGYIWGVYNPEVVKLLKKKRNSNVSVEIEVIESLTDERGFEIIYDFSLLGVTVIGVEAGIEGASVLLDFAKSKKYNDFVRVFSKVLSNEEEKNEDIPIGLCYSLDKNNISTDNWSVLSKTEMRERLLKDKDFKKYIKKLYLVVPFNWEQDPKSLLKYPIYQIKENNVVININAVNKACLLLSKEKEKDYYNIATSKVDILKQRFGNELIFGIETNQDGDKEIEKEQPKIIQMEGKMKLKELQASLRTLFQTQEESTQELVRLSKERETKVEVSEFAEDDEKVSLTAEIDTLSQRISELEVSIASCKDELLLTAKELAEKEDEEEEPEKEEMEEKETDVETWEYSNVEADESELSKLLQEQEPFTILSVTKNYVVYLKDKEVYLKGYKIDEVQTEGSEEVSKVYSLTEEETIKAEKLFTTFKTGGTLGDKDVLPYPIGLVEISTNHASLMDTIVEKSNQISEYESKISEADKKYSTLQEEYDKYKKDTLDFVLFFEERTRKEKIKESFQKEVLDKIFNQEYKNKEDLETQINSQLYVNGKSKYLHVGISGGKPDTIKTPEEKLNGIIESYRNKQ